MGVIARNTKRSKRSSTSMDNRTKLDGPERKLWRQLEASLDPSLRDKACNTTPLSQLLAALIQQSRDRWPDVTLDPLRFATFLAERLSGEASSLEEALTRVHATDLWLTAATITGDPAALQEIRALIRALVRRFIRTLQLGEDIGEDVEQALASRLLVGTDSGPPTLPQYQGQGSLRSWLRVAALREVLRQSPRNDTEQFDADDLFVQLNLDVPTLELTYLKATYRQEFRTAFRAAVAELPVRDRNLVRYLGVEGLAIHEIATLYKVNRSTVWRWLTSTKKKLLRSTRKRLAAQMALSPDAVDSIIRFIESRLDATLDDVV